MFEISARKQRFSAQASPVFSFWLRPFRATGIFPNRSYEDTETPRAPRLRGLRRLRVLPFVFDFIFLSASVAPKKQNGGLLERKGLLATAASRHFVSSPPDWPPSLNALW
jgi:hypothetical protein